MGLGGALGSLLGGLCADRLSRRSERWLLFVPALASTALLPFLLAFCFAESTGLALLFFLPACCSQPVLSRSLLRRDPGAGAAAHAGPRRRDGALRDPGRGLGIGPLLVGMLNDVLAPRLGAEAIRYTVAAVGIFNLWGATRSLLGARSVRADLERARVALAPGSEGR